MLGVGVVNEYLVSFSRTNTTRVFFGQSPTDFRSEWTRKRRL